ncbi:putative lipid II flippase FtsW [Nitratireductor aquimarinus]|uniref:putative lipid II flippase FtsW n=1 Tax=Alphaproteobacteria TaxID=28211 RepID=UPI000DDFBA21|nr:MULTISPECIES: putative lipid II flippase FtsW [Alphaproteobacteria]MBY6022194.1 putative lipid II flippase FtsW [Nitratireductor sp. DP7N14-4]MBN7757405.1 putative lipid II flippase FtsW [Nitratireductor aquimarinus]MBN7762831.1 putative lipid II flippase FtsW [Nitratireductor aquibiodomus]MBN7774796.1 putative lipid II flippase FtsW [Nitratireductor pacificus]MBN7779657.1 putative lipid II flippase FtsW [Nitratireductor pacificus]
MVSRTDRSPVANWWWTIDRWFLGAFLLLMGLGVVLSFAASPAVADRIGLSSFHFVTRQIVYMLPAVVVMIGVSFLSPRLVRRLALVMLVGALALMVLTLFAGMEVKGSRRWLHIFGVSIQPSEYLKPAFVVICAWLFHEHARQPEIPGNLFAMLLLGLVIALLVAQPDLGQTMLVLGTWGAMFFIAGMPWLWIAVLGALGAGGAFLAYTIFPHVADRIDRFLTGEGDTYQVDMSIEAITRGGWFGRGPGEGTVKRILPDSHTDFVFAVAGEEFGIIILLIILSIFAFVVLRGLSKARREEDDFTRYAVSGLVILFGFQSIINMGVNVRMLPAKGMTLPFISYGGSSLIAMAISMGFVLALTRRKPEKRRPVAYAQPAGREAVAG